MRSWYYIPDSKVDGANMGPIWGRQDPDGPHIGPMNLAIWVGLFSQQYSQNIPHSQSIRTSYEVSFVISKYGGCLNINMSPIHSGNSHYKSKTVSLPSYFYGGNEYWKNCLFIETGPRLKSCVCQLSCFMLDVVVLDIVTMGLWYEEYEMIISKIISNVWKIWKDALCHHCRNIEGHWTDIIFNMSSLWILRIYICIHCDMECDWHVDVMSYSAEIMSICNKTAGDFSNNSFEMWAVGCWEASLTWLCSGRYVTQVQGKSE